MRRGIRLKFVKPIRKPTGKMYLYYAKPGHKLVRLPELPENDPEFLRAYAEAARAAPKARSTRAATDGTIAALVVSYKNSPAFRGLRGSTKEMRGRILDKISDKGKSAFVADLGPRHIRADIAHLTPHAANNRLKVWRALTKHACEEDMIEVDPARDVKKRKVEGGGHHCWTDDEIARYRAHHQSGTKARLAFELFLWTGARRGDVVRLGRQNINNGSLSYVAEKTGVEVCIPILPEFHFEMAEMPKSQMLFLETVHGKPHSVKAFGAWFKKRCIEAGLPDHCTAHGLRKARARIMAEAGKTSHQIAAWGGWKTLAEVTHYTEAADRKRLTHDGVEQEQNFGNSIHKVSKNPEKPN